MLCAVGLTVAQSADAQDAPAAAPTAAPVAEPAPAPAPAPVETAPAAPAPVVAPTPEPPPPPAEVAPPPEEPAAEEAPSPISVGAWLHLGTNLEGPGDKLNRVTSDGELNLLFSADLIDGFGMTANLVGVYGTDTMSGDVSIMDLHGKIGIDDAFNVWIGRMLVPSDRANFSGVWFEAPWTYPGLAGNPRQGPSGRNDGVTVWGQIEGGLFKYYLGAFDLHRSGTEIDGAPNTALFSGRLNLSLINPEPGYYHSSTYYGGKDLLAIGIGFQYQKDGTLTIDDSDPDMIVVTEAEDYSEFNADILFEKNFGSGGVLDLEAAFYKKMGDLETIDYSWLGLVSWMTAEKIGAGHIQPLVRVQQAKPKGGGDATTLAEFQAGYVIDGYATRLALGYGYGTDGTNDDHKIYLGLQLQK